MITKATPFPKLSLFRSTCAAIVSASPATMPTLGLKEEWDGPKCKQPTSRTRPLTALGLGALILCFALSAAARPWGSGGSTGSGFKNHVEPSDLICDFSHPDSDVQIASQPSVVDPNALASLDISGPVVCFEVPLNTVDPTPEDALPPGLGLFELKQASVLREFPAIEPGFDSFTLPANDDGSTAEVFLGFEVDFFGTTYNSLFVNNNGNVTFDFPLSTFTPFPLSGTNRVIIAPFFGDVDTREGNVVTYGTGEMNGRKAFGVNWPGVRCYNVRDSTNTGAVNTFQLRIVDRSDIASGAFDIFFGYDSIQWETGQASGGNISCLGGQSARVGYSNGTGTFFELPGSGVPGAFLDTNPDTALILQSPLRFQVRGGMPDPGVGTPSAVFTPGFNFEQICNDDPPTAMLPSGRDDPVGCNELSRVWTVTALYDDMGNLETEILFQLEAIDNVAEQFCVPPASGDEACKVFYGLENPGFTTFGNRQGEEIIRTETITIAETEETPGPEVVWTPCHNQAFKAVDAFQLSLADDAPVRTDIRLTVDEPLIVSADPEEISSLGTLCGLIQSSEPTIFELSTAFNGVAFNGVAPATGDLELFLVPPGQECDSAYGGTIVDGGQATVHVLTDSPINCTGVLGDGTEQSALTVSKIVAERPVQIEVSPTINLNNKSSTAVLPVTIVSCTIGRFAIVFDPDGGPVFPMVAFVNGLTGLPIDVEHFSVSDTISRPSCDGGEALDDLKLKLNRLDFINAVKAAVPFCENRKASVPLSISVGNDVVGFVQGFLGGKDVVDLNHCEVME